MAKTTSQIKDHLEVSRSLSHKEIMVSNFLGGLAWGLGSVIGATVVAAILISILQTVGAFEPISQFIESITKSIPKK